MANATSDKKPAKVTRMNDKAVNINNINKSKQPKNEQHIKDVKDFDFTSAHSNVTKPKKSIISKIKAIFK